MSKNRNRFQKAAEHLSEAGKALVYPISGAFGLASSFMGSIYLQNFHTKPALERFFNKQDLPGSVEALISAVTTFGPMVALTGAGGYLGIKAAQKLNEQEASEATLGGLGGAYLALLANNKILNRETIELLVSNAPENSEKLLQWGAVAVLTCAGAALGKVINHKAQQNSPAQSMQAQPATNAPEL